MTWYRSAVSGHRVDDPDLSGSQSLLDAGDVEALRARLDVLASDATRPLLVAAGLGDLETLQERFADASDDERFEALVVAAIHGRSTAARILVDRGVDPSRFAPEGAHPHATPLHLAVGSGSVSTVCTLVTRGADPTICDARWDATALGWARYLGNEEIEAFLLEAETFMPAVTAVRHGDVSALRAWLSEHPQRVDAYLGDNPRSLLHYATDWPGHLPNVRETIVALLEAGANPNIRLEGDGETPLHWAASSDDVDAADALIEGGAELMPPGGCIADRTPLDLAVIFGNWRVADRLLRAGAELDPWTDPRWDQAVAKAPEELRVRIRDATRAQ